MNKLKLSYLLKTFKVLTLSLLFISTASAQTYTFDQIKEFLLVNRPQSGDVALRYDCFRSMDELIINAYPPLNPDIENFYNLMIKKALIEIQTEHVTEGATVWLLYNLGYVVKTPSVTLGFDLNDYYQCLGLDDLADVLDIYFISHYHGDHHNKCLIDAMRVREKNVVGPPEMYEVNIKMDAGDTWEDSGVQVTAHMGYHSAPVRQFEVVTPEGIMIIHTGDNDSPLNIPVPGDEDKPDILLLNCWMDGGGVDIMQTVDTHAHPRVLLPGHMMELGHLFIPEPIFEYSVMIPETDDEFNADYCVLGWGERYHYGASNDITPPNVVTELKMHRIDKYFIFTWDKPEPARDGDRAAFYRIIADSRNEFYSRSEYYVSPMLIKNLKVYAYDHCGNQSTNYAEYTFVHSPSNIKINKIP